MTGKEISNLGRECSAPFSGDNSRLIFAADIGATHCRFALFRQSEISTGTDIAPELICWQMTLSCSFQNGNTLLETMRKWILDTSQDHWPMSAVLSLAGPIIGNSCVITNLGWEIHIAEAQRILGISSLLLINDFVAQGFATLLPDHVQLATIQQGNKILDYPSALIGAGTGCGKALLLPTSPLTVLPSEGGQTDFPCISHYELNFATFILKNTGKKRLTTDMILSGSGLVHLLHYVTGQKLHPLEAANSICQEPLLLSFFATLYGRACKNFVLETMSVGGLYITSGVAAHLPVLQHKNFLKEFHDGPEWLADIPVHHLQHKLSGLWGSALYAAYQYPISSRS